MTEDQAKKHLRKMLRSFTGGTVLHLLAELYQEAAEEAQRLEDDLAYRQSKRVEATLFVVGLGIDSAHPRN